MTELDTTLSPIDSNIQLACDIATGKVQALSDSPAISMIGALKNYNGKGRRNAHWFRMAYRNGSWTYISSGYLPKGNYLASERRPNVFGDVYFGDVYIGEITITHDLGASTVDDNARLVVTEDNPHSVECPVKVTRAGLEVTLPDGSIVKTPNPRKK